MQTLKWIILNCKSAWALEEHPDRDSPEYDGRMYNIRSVKLDALRSIQGEVGDYDDPEASHEDGSNMDVDG